MILCCGDALIDMLPRTLPDGTRVLFPATGGAAFNTAIALGRLGEPVGLLAGLSTDMFGRQIAADLSRSGVDVAACVRSDRPTTLAFVELTEGNARYTFYDEQTANRALRLEDIPDLSETVTALHFGAVSLIQEPCGTAYEALLNREADASVISFDPNIRPGFVSDEAAYRARIRRMAAKSDLIKVSDEDLAWLEPDRPTSGIVEEWLTSGTAIVVVTEGAEGAIAFTARTELRVPALPTKVVDTVGAGDAFTAGLLAALQQRGALKKQALRQIGDRDLHEALLLAGKVAAVVVSRVGANPPWLMELTADGHFRQS